MYDLCKLCKSHYTNMLTNVVSQQQQQQRPGTINILSICLRQLHGTKNSTLFNHEYNTMDIIHTEDCITAIFKNKCDECRKIISRERTRRCRAKKKEKIIETRLQV